MKRALSTTRLRRNTARGAAPFWGKSSLTLRCDGGHLLLDLTHTNGIGGSEGSLCVLGRRV